MSAQRDELRVPKGTVIFRQGDPGHEMFVISEGQVRLAIGTGGIEKEVGLFGPGMFFGELSLLSEEPRSATATAAEDSTLLVIGRDVFKMMVQDDLDIVFRMMNIQGQRLGRTNQPVQDLTQRMVRVRVAARCLQRLGGTDPQLPFTVDMQQLASELAVSPEAVNATVTDLVQRGIGSVEGHRWSIQKHEHVDQLIAALCAYAAGPLTASVHVGPSSA
jgi:CRP/FNR family transcriptional regulator, cyclic AMP receptor protein